METKKVLSILRKIKDIKQSINMMSYFEGYELPDVSPLKKYKSFQDNMLSDFDIFPADVPYKCYDRKLSGKMIHKPICYHINLSVLNFTSMILEHYDFPEKKLFNFLVQFKKDNRELVTNDRELELAIDTWLKFVSDDKIEIVNEIIRNIIDDINPILFTDMNEPPESLYYNMLLFTQKPVDEKYEDLFREIPCNNVYIKSSYEYMAELKTKTGFDFLVRLDDSKIITEFIRKSKIRKILNPV